MTRFAALALVLLASGAHAREPFHVEFKPLAWDVLATEVAWQAENVIDLNQTLEIARDPQHYSEVGTMSPITGPHPQCVKSGYSRPCSPSGTTP